VSGRRIGAALRAPEHDVLAVAEERDLDGCPDEELMELADAQRRIMVTFDVADFPRICHEWLEAGKPHHGCAVVVVSDTTSLAQSCTHWKLRSRYGPTRKIGITAWFASRGRGDICGLCGAQICQEQLGPA
jgi:hypothetical protein